MSTRTDAALDAVHERLHRLSLRARLIAVVLGLLVVALVATGAITLVVLHRVLLGQVDDDLLAVTSSPSRIAALRAAEQDPPGEAYPSDYVVQISDAEGVPRWVTPEPPNHSGAPLRLRDLDLAEAQRREGEPFTVSADGERWRVAVTPATLTAASGRGSVTGSVAVSRSLKGVEASTAAVAAWFVLVGVLVVLAGAVLGAGAITRAFRPLREVESVATAFGAGDTSRRVDAAPPGTEVGRLGRAVNAMLDRIETSLAAREASEARMRRFVADASHELRTPLAAVRGFAELHRIGAVREPGEVTAAFGRIEAEAVRMGGLVDDLLLLARLDEQRPLRQDPVDLLLIAADACQDARALAPDRSVGLAGVDGAPPAPVVVVGDDARLRQVLANLLANALRHTPAGTPVELGVGVRDGWALWQVVDHGAGIPAQDAERVFERFWRADSSRARGGGGGSGLGMAIVAAIVHASGGAVRVVPTPGGGATIEVALPLAGAAVPVPDDDVPGDLDVPDLDAPDPDVPDPDVPDPDAPGDVRVRTASRTPPPP